MKSTALLPLLLLVLCAVSASDAGAQGTSATLVNGSGFDIYELYLSPSNQARWGPDQLGEYVLESDMSFTLSGMGCGHYDLKLVDEDGDECVVMEQHLCGDMGDWVLTDEELLECAGFETDTASATLINQSRWDIYALFISPTHEAQWGPDQLGKYVLESGTSYTLTSIACGNYDVKMVDEDGDECVLEEIYLCGAEQAVITDKDLLACQGY